LKLISTIHKNFAFNLKGSGFTLARF